MRVLLDECVNRRMLRSLSDHEFRTSRQMGWSSLANGSLLEVAQEAFDVLVTQDANMPHQQSISKFKIAVVVLRARSNRIDGLLPLVPGLLTVLDHCQSGTVTYVESPSE